MYVYIYRYVTMFIHWAYTRLYHIMFLGHDVSTKLRILVVSGIGPQFVGSFDAKGFYRIGSRPFCRTLIPNLRYTALLIGKKLQGQGFQIDVL